MSTRSTTHFAERSRTRAIVYRHSDGYPSGAGADIKRFLERVRDTCPDNRLNDPSYLAAKYVVFLAEQFAVDYDWKNGGKTIPKQERLDFLSVGIEMDDPGDIEYRYTIHCDSFGDDGLPEVTCEDVIEKRTVNPFKDEDEEDDDS